MIVRTVLAAGLLLGVPGSGWAQTGEIVAAPSPDADALAADMRLLADNPEDLATLIDAGELATRIGDTAAASALFTRAERIAPRDPHLQAARATLLVRNERPGEALRLFSMAESSGQSMIPYLADRGLAYDLTGDQLRAQRDYREALRRQQSDEITRRYALSLGISGKRDQALELLDPLVRRSDRGGWRVRSFVLAMTGDVAGARQIATSMLPPGMASGLDHFFEILPGLSAADRAFAVHFGELRMTPERVADARLAPQLTPLTPEPEAAPLTALAATSVRGTKTDRGRRRRGELPPVGAPSRPVQIAALRPSLPPPPREEVVIDPSPAPNQAAIVPETSTRVPTPQASTPQRPVANKPSDAVVERPVQMTVSPPVDPLPSAVAAVPTAQTPVASQPRSSGGAVSNEVSVASPSPPSAKRTAPAGPVRSDDLVLANIVADVVEDVVEPAAGPAPAPGKRADADAAKPLPSRKSDRAKTDKPVVEKPGTEKSPDLPSAKGKKSTEPADCDPQIKTKGRKSTHQAAPVKKPKRGDKAVTSSCPTEKDADPRTGKKGKPDPAKTDPSRIWVQVAGGANEGDLAKAWASVRAKASAAFKGKTAWSTPLRATNRVLTGPFKTSAEAQAFVNLVAKSGVSAFVFTSEAGQKIDKLGAQ